METTNDTLTDEYCPDCDQYGIHFCRKPGFKQFYKELMVEKSLKESEKLEYGKDIPHTGVYCKMCGGLWLWGLSWNGSKQEEFICDLCKEQMEKDYQPYKDDR